MAGKSALLLGAATLALNANAATASQSVPTSDGRAAPHYAHYSISGTPPSAQTLYDQNADDKGVYVVSTYFDSSFDSYDDQAADDFVVPPAHTWVIEQVDVAGQYFNGSGPDNGVNIFVYKDRQGKPNNLAGQCLRLIPAHDNFGSYTLKLPRTCWFRLKGGTAGTRYWLSVAAIMVFEDGSGEWGWEVSSVQHGDQAMWQNPKGGFGICPAWDTIENCIGPAYGPDLMFALKGKAK